MERTSSNAPGGLGHIDSFVRTWGVKMEPPAKDEFVMDKHIPTLVDPRHFQGAKIGLEMALPAIFALAFVMGTHQRLKNTGKQTCSSSSASGGNPSTHKNVLDSPVNGLDGFNVIIPGEKEANLATVRGLFPDDPPADPVTDGGGNGSVALALFLLLFLE